MFDILDLLLRIADTEPVGTPEVTEPSTDVTTPTEPETTVEPTIEPSSTIPEAPSTFNIDGEELTIEQIREMRSNSLNHADYMAQLNKIKQMEEQNKDAVELFNYLKDKPELTRKMYELDSELSAGKTLEPLDPMAERLMAMENRFRLMDTERQLDSICSKDNMVTKGDILRVATESRCDINTAYNIWKGQNFDKILKTRLDEQSKSLTQQIKSNQTITKTAISSGDKINNGDATFGLSESEQIMARKLGMTLEEYKKWSV